MSGFSRSEESLNQVHDLDWEQQWDEDVVAGLTDDQLIDSTGMQLMPAGVQSMQLEDWDDWGDLPGQLPSGDPIEVNSLDSTGEFIPPYLTNSSSRGPSSYRPDSHFEQVHAGDKEGFKRPAPINVLAEGLAEKWADESIASPSAAGPPGLTDSPGISLARRGNQNTSDLAGGRGEPSGPPTPEQEELGRFVEKWEAEFRPLDDYMTSNEITLIEVMRKRTDDWIRRNAGNSSAEECRRKTEHLQRILAVVKMRKDEVQTRPEAVRSLTDIVDTVQSFLREPDAANRKGSLPKIQQAADEAAEWLKGPLARQADQAKYLDPFILTKDIYAKEKELREVAIHTFGRAKLAKEMSGAGQSSSHAGAADEEETLIPASRKSPASPQNGWSMQQQGTSGSRGVAAQAPAMQVQRPAATQSGCMIQ